MLGHAQAAHAIDLQGPSQTLRVVGVDARRGLRIDLRQLTVQRVPTFDQCARFQRGVTVANMLRELLAREFPAEEGGLS